MKKLRGVDLLCGVGGFALGLQQAGIQIIRSMDFNAAALEVHRANIKEVKTTRFQRVPPHGWKWEPVPEPINGKFQRGQIHKSRKVPHVADLTAVIDIAPEIAIDRPDIIFGGPPCQAFARSGGLKRDEDERSRLTEAFAILVASARPKYFVMENVPGLRTSQTFERAMAIFKACGYGITAEVVKAAHYDVPQGRERLITVGCIDETDGWFADYLHQYRAEQPMTVADLFGPDFGTLLSDFELPKGFKFLDRDEVKPPKDLWFRERDQQRLDQADVNKTTRFYHANPGGKSSARIHRTDRPCPTLIRSTMDRLPENYRPLEGDPVDLEHVYQPTFEQFSLMGGFPHNWEWPDLLPKGARRTKGKMMAGAEKRNLMLANAVPPPLARAIGRAIVDHHEGKAPVILAPAATLSHWCLAAKNSRSPKYRQLERYRNWLRVGKRKERKAVTQAITDLRKAKLLVASRSLPSITEELAAFDNIAAAARTRSSRRSQLRRALLDLAEFENYQAHVQADLVADDDAAYAEDFHIYYGPDAKYPEPEHEASPLPTLDVFFKRVKGNDGSSAEAAPD